MTTSKIVINVRSCVTCPFKSRNVRTNQAVCNGYVPEEMAPHRPQGFVGLPVHLDAGYVPWLVNPGENLPSPPRWCPILANDVEITFQDGVGSLWPEDIGEIPDFLKDKEK